MQHTEKVARHEENMLMQKGEVQKDFSKVADAAPMSFADTAQKFFVYSLSHRSIPPLATNPKSPGLRILRAFALQDDAIEYAKDFAADDTVSSVFVGAQGSWNLGAAEFGQLEDASVAAELTQTIVDSHEERVRSLRTAFEDRVKNTENKTQKNASGKQRKKGTTQQTARSETFKQQEFVKATNNVSQNYQSLTQKFSVIALIPDPRPSDTELLFVFQFIRAFETEAEADVFIRNTAGAHFPNIDLFVNRNYIWTDVGTLDSKVRSHYRDEKLQAILDRHDQQQNEAEAHRKMCEEQNVQPRVIEIGPAGMEIEEPAEPEPQPEPEPEPEPLRRSQRLRG